MSASRKPDARLPEELIAEAAGWCARMDPHYELCESPADDLALRNWLADDPRRRDAFDAVSRTMTDPDLIEALRQFDDARSFDSADDTQSTNRAPVAPIVRESRLLGTMRSRAWIGAAVVLMCAAWFAWPALDVALTPQSVVTTAPGKARSIELPDGSRVELNGGTSLQVRLASTQRIVRMEQGEAFFTIAPDPDRPFIVEAAGGRVEVRGTAFGLSQTRDGLELAVHHGRVAFGSAGLFANTIDLVAGERAQLSSGIVSPARHFDLDAGDWRTGWLQTDGITLAGLADRLNRQHHIVVTVDPSLADKRIAGRFRLHEPEALLRRLSAIHGFAVARTEAGLAIRLPSTAI